jgi:uncharacterized membrane protein YhaH (DUF805 family)
MRLTELLFSFKGRINRKPWWLATIAFGVAASVITGLIEVAARSAGQTAIDPRPIKSSRPEFLGRWLASSRLPICGWPLPSV